MNTLYSLVASVFYFAASSFAAEQSVIQPLQGYLANGNCAQAAQYLRQHPEIKSVQVSKLPGVERCFREIRAVDHFKIGNNWNTYLNYLHDRPFRRELLYSASRELIDEYHSIRNKNPEDYSLVEFSYDVAKLEERFRSFQANQNRVKEETQRRERQQQERRQQEQREQVERARRENPLEVIQAYLNNNACLDVAYYLTQHPEISPNQLNRLQGIEKCFDQLRNIARFKIDAATWNTYLGYLNERPLIRELLSSDNRALRNEYNRICNKRPEEYSLVEYSYDVAKLEDRFNQFKAARQGRI